MTSLKPRMQAHFDELWDKATEGLTRNPLTGKFKESEILTKLLDLVDVDIEAAKLRKARAVLDFLARPESESDNENPQPTQLVLQFSDGDRYPFSPRRVIRDSSGGIIEAERALLEDKRCDLERANENLGRVTLWRNRKLREVQIHETWVSAQPETRPPLQLTWGNCVRETHLLIEPVKQPEPQPAK
jgi:hypothetical protein